MIERPAGVSNGFFGSHPPALLDPAAVDLVDAFLFANPGGRDRLIPLLQCVQDELGHLPMEAQELVADRLAMSPIQVAGVVSFYDCSRSPRGHPSRSGSVRVLHAMYRVEKGCSMRSPIPSG